MLEKLQIFFHIFVPFNIYIRPTKKFLNYPKVGLLRQNVTFLSLTTMEEKLRAIRELTYLDILRALKYYLGLTGYFHSYIDFYAQLAKSLQE